MSKLPKPRRQKQFVVYLNVNGDDKQVYTSKFNYDVDCVNWIKEKQNRYPFDFPSSLDFTISANVLTYPRTASKITFFAVVRKLKNDLKGRLVRLYESIEDAEKAIYDIWYAANNDNDFGYCKAMYNNGCLECYSNQYEFVGYAPAKVSEYQSDTYSIQEIEL